MKKYSLIFTSFILFSLRSWSQHTGCATIYDKQLCETESTYNFKSEHLNWEIDKFEFQEKVFDLLLSQLNLEGSSLIQVYLWSNDFDSIQTLKIQVWNEQKKVLLTLPLDYHTWENREVLHMTHLVGKPYPLSYGYTLGEILITCKEKCTEENFRFLNSNNFTSYDLVLESILILKVAPWTEEISIEKIKNNTEFSNLFKNIELSPSIEANGVSGLGFQFIR